MSSKTSEIENNNYVIIEDNNSINLLTSKRNDDEKKAQEANLKTNLKDNKVESMTSKNTELS